MKEVSLCRVVVMYFFNWGNGYDVWYFFFDFCLFYLNEMMLYLVKKVLFCVWGKNVFVFFW